MIADQRSAGTDLLEALNQEPVTISKQGSSQRGEVVKVILSGSPLALDAAEDEIRLSIPIMQRSMDQFNESSNPGATKKEALREVLNRIGVAREQCMGIADGDTDTGWLSDIGIAVAVSNARESVRNMADIHIGHRSNDSVAAFLDSYFGLHPPSQPCIRRVILRVSLSQHSRTEHHDDRTTHCRPWHRLGPGPVRRVP